MNLYDATVPVLKHYLSSLHGFLGALETHLEKTSLSAGGAALQPGAFLDARLAPDMFPLKRQIQIACDSAKGLVARVANVENPKHEDNETSVAELKARVEKVIAFMDTAKRSDFDGAENREVTFPVGPTATAKMKAHEFALYRGMPNFFFHTVTAYALLRHNGVHVGKNDFLRPEPFLLA
jgi:uncharacterized protein